MAGPEICVLRSPLNMRWLGRQAACLAVAMGWVVSDINMSVSAEPARIDFVHTIRPLLADRCFRCHGPDVASLQAELRLDQAESLFGELTSGDGRAIVPGSTEKSVLYQRITAEDPEDRMPPPDSHLALGPEEIASIRAWIEAGADYRPHWAFQPIAGDLEPPSTKDTTWSRQPIDQFILARLEAQGLTPAREADRLRWLRRVTFDLTGLPPTPGECAAFLENTSSMAYEEVVERLLASPHFGEHFAVPWLDAARYADSYGYQSDLLMRVWPYRDWVIDAFNRNLPFDQFLTRQLAGDLLPQAGPQDRVATAFNRLHRQTNEGGSIDEEFRTEYAADRVQTFGGAMLGVTLECCKCHDHKYDPFTQRDFYRFFAFFNNVDESGTYNDMEHTPSPTMELPTAEQAARSAELEERLRELDEALDRHSADDMAFADWKGTGPRLDRQPPDGHWLFTPPLTIVAPMIFATRDSKLHFAPANPPSAIGSALPTGKSGTSEEGNAWVDVPVESPADPLDGHTPREALRLSGDDGVTLPLNPGWSRPENAFTVIVRIRIPAGLREGIVWHAEEGTDTGFHGVELVLTEGRLRFAQVHFWPGNALAVETSAPLPTDRWLQVAVVSRGTGRAASTSIFVDGVCQQNILRDQLTKRPGGEIANLTIGARFRSPGLRDALLSEVWFFSRSLTRWELLSLDPTFSLDQLEAIEQEAVLRENFELGVMHRRREMETRRRAILAAWYDNQDAIQDLMVMAELSEPRPTYLLARGEYNAPRVDEGPVGRGVPEAALSPWDSTWPLNRLGLARWLTDARHPLTARVAVNRIWRNFFGRGLVESQENFGTQGSPPSHPELLDWLAHDFRSHAWDMKRICKMIALSAVYRQDSRCDSELRQRDPWNELLGRGPSRRLSAEMIRDLALSASGLLSSRVGGPPAYPYQPAGLWRENNGMTPEFNQGTGEELYRRSLYTVWKRTAPQPGMSVFDAPGREVCVARRPTTNTPLQAYVLLNDVQFVEAARVMAQRHLLPETPFRNALIPIHMALTGREPTPREEGLYADLYHDRRQHFQSHPEAAQALLSQGATPLDTAGDPNSIAAMTLVVQLILNGDATVWLR